MTPREPISLDLLTDYVAGECTPDQRALVEQWVMGHSRREQWLNYLYAIRRDAAHLPGPDVDPESIVRWVAAQIAIGEPEPSHPKMPSTSSWIGRRWTSERTLGFLFGTGLALCIATIVMALARRGTVDRTATTGTTYQTRPGEFATVRLTDGSILVLAPATKVVDGADDVRVTGQAYFTATPHASRPLTVRTRNALVHVLGTRFVVRQYADESSSRVVVEEGRVALRPIASGVGHGGGTVLSARMLAQVTDSGVSVTSGIATQIYTGWTQGTLVFDGAPLRDVVAELRRVYDADIRVSDSALAGRAIIAEVAVSHRTLPQVLNAICFVLGAHYTRVGDTFTLAEGRRGGELPRGKDQQHVYPQPEKLYGR